MIEFGISQSFLSILRVFLVIAKHDDKVCTVDMIMKETDLSRPTIEKVFKVLRGNELIETLRGIKGGARLLPKAYSTTVTDLALLVCKPSGRPVPKVVEKAYGAMQKVFDRVFLTNA